MEPHATFDNGNIKYAKITLKKRQQLIRQILVKNQFVSKASKKLHIKLSTAKLIVKRYKEEGTFFESKTNRTKRLENEENITQKSSSQKRTLSFKQNKENNQENIGSNINKSTIIIPQPFYFDNYWMQPFPHLFFNLQGMMFYQL